MPTHRSGRSKEGNVSVVGRYQVDDSLVDAGTILPGRMDGHGREAWVGQNRHGYLSDIAETGMTIQDPWIP